MGHAYAGTNLYEPGWPSDLPGCKRLGEAEGPRGQVGSKGVLVQAMGQAIACTFHVRRAITRTYVQETDRLVVVRFANGRLR
jgi:hypothetical protein